MKLIYVLLILHLKTGGYLNVIYLTQPISCRFWFLQLLVLTSLGTTTSVYFMPYEANVKSTRGGCWQTVKSRVVHVPIGPPSYRPLVSTTA